VAIAVVVKLTRVLLLAPVVAAVGMLQHRTASRPPVVPLFVLGFLGCVLLRSVGLVPAGVLPVLTQLQTLALAAALFSLGTGVRLAALVRRGGPALVLGALSTVAVAGLSLAGVLWIR
jgi:uncharacterized membrane protein YadS